MKITHLASGQPYHLKPGTQLEVERPNLFFNEWGEQTIPIELPDTDHNKALLGNPELIANRKKNPSPISVIIEDGEYFMPSRQVVLGVKPKSGISTSFYMNEGSFLSKISKVSLTEIFRDETIPNVSTVEEGLDFCRSLADNTHPEFSIFPVLIESNEMFEDGSPKSKFINRFGFTDHNGVFNDIPMVGEVGDFYNAVQRIETENDLSISLNSGYYISPFIRANYLLKRIFQFFGYTLAPNFFTFTKPFPDMVFINNCADALVGGKIHLVDLVPDCMCSDILNVFRKKFCCEFIPNEIEKIVYIKLFNELLEEQPEFDLTPFLVSEIESSFPESYQQLIIDSEDKVSVEDSTESFDSIPVLIEKYPNVSYDKFDGCFYRLGYGFAGIKTGTHPVPLLVKDKIGTSFIRYYGEGNLKTKEIKVPDILPCFAKIHTDAGNATHNVNAWRAKLLYIGSPNFLNSKIETEKIDPESSDNIETTSDNESLKPMLAFAYQEFGFPCGTITNYNSSHYVSALPDEYSRLFDYSLCYNGEDGVFEKFYRKFDELYRNSLHELKASFLLSNAYKVSIPAHSPVLLNNQRVLINTFKYAIGGRNEPIDAELYTCKLYEPVSSAKPFSYYFPDLAYEWIVKLNVDIVTEAQYLSSPYKDKVIETIFPPNASDELAIPGKQYYNQLSCIKRVLSTEKPQYLLITFWLECCNK